jgi:asparagine synthase (glutamine-hydrolysing)
MCGIFGALIKNKKDKDLITIAKDAIVSLKHRGPDDDGYWISERDNVVMVQTRLSIIDLTSNAHQPFIDDEGRYILVFNGEIYNFEEIRIELIKLGYKFKSNSDTEVVLYSFIEWGKECVNKFEGMFAFSVFDTVSKEMYLFRDRVGVKPLYYSDIANNFVFASELKSIYHFHNSNLSLSKSSLKKYFINGYISGSESIYYDVFKLPPATYMHLTNTGEKKIVKYWTPVKSESSDFIIKDESVVDSELTKLLTESFQKRLVSDVPVGLFLSGGIDSSLIAATINKMGVKLNTYTIGFNNSRKFDESIWAEKVAKYLNLNHETFNISSEDAINLINDIADVYDEPFSDNSAIPTILLSKLVSKKVKVVLSGDGADELFGGYTHYKNIVNDIENNKSIFAKSIIEKTVNTFSQSRIKKMFSLFGFPRSADFDRVFYHKIKSKTLFDFYNSHTAVWLPSEVDALLNLENISFLSEKNSKQDYNNNIRALMSHEFHNFLPDDILYKVDRATMKYGLEAREPFLDKELIEFSLRLPNDMLLKNGESKYILKKNLEKYLPKELIYRKKQGFVIPVEDWLKTCWKPLVEIYLNKERVSKTQVLNVDIVNSVITNFYSGKSVYTYNVWSLLVFSLWLERWKNSFYEI